MLRGEPRREGGVHVGDRTKSSVTVRLTPSEHFPPPATFGTRGSEPGSSDLGELLRVVQEASVEVTTLSDASRDG